MAKNIKRMLAMVLVLFVFASALPMQALAAEPEHTTETSPEGLLTDVTTTTETETDENGNVVITVTIDKNTEGVIEEDGKQVTLDREESEVTTTTEKPDGTTSTLVEESGTETKEWIEEDLGNEPGQPEVVTPIVPGETTEGVGGVEKSEPVTNPDGSVTTITTTDRTVTAETSEEKIDVDVSDTHMEALQPELKFDRNSKADQNKESLERELYADNGHFHNPDDYTVTDAPEAYPFEYVGHGDYSAHYVSHVRVIYERDADGNPVKDENGEYVIKELQHANGTTLTKNGVPTTDLNGPYDQPTGTRPLQFMLKNEDGDTVYAYCIDVDTGAETGKYYQVANLEDNDYYASEDAENHVRNIVTNGYWGTAEGTGSMTKIKEDLKAAVASGLVDKEYDISFMIQEAYTEGYELKDGETIYTNSKGKKFIHRVVTEHIVLTDEVIDAFTEGEALDATQSAIWSFANGSKYALDGTDRMIVGDITYASSALGDGRNGQNDYAGAARTLAFYTYLVNLDEELTSTTIINDKNNVEDINLVIGDKVAGAEANQDNNVNNDIYEAEMNFTLAFVPDAENDDLLVHITYMHQGEEVTVIKRLAGTNTEEDAKKGIETITPEEGVYTLSGLQLSENEDLTFDLRLEGIQNLVNGVYIYTAEGGIGKSQTMVGMGQGTQTVDVSKSVTIRFDVDENNRVVAEREWHDEYDPNEEPEEPPMPVIFRLDVDGTEEIPEEPVPLAAPVVTGDSSFPWLLIAVMAAFGIVVINLFGKKRAA